MGQPQGASTTAAGRLDGSVGTLAVAADFALGVGWGSVATKAVVATSNSQRGTLTITASTTGVAQATATVVLTFPDGAYAVAPFVLANSSNDNSIDTGRFKVTTVTATAVTFTFSLLPVDTKIYVLNYVVIA